MRRVLLFIPAMALLLMACGPSAQGLNPVAQLGGKTRQAPAAPAALQATSAAGQAVKPNGWTNQATIKLSASLSSPEAGASLLPEVEFLPADQPFSGSPTVSGKAGDSSIQAPAMAAGQTYHWQIRARDAAGAAGPWVPFDGTIGFDPTPPPSPSLATLPNNGYVSKKQVPMSWDAVAGKSGIAGFAYSADQAANGQPPQQAMTKDTSATVTLGSDGDWFFHVRTLDNAGNWSPTATVPLHLDSVPLALNDVLYRTFAYNPGFDTLHINFTLSKPAVLTVSIIPERTDAALKTFDLGQQPAGPVKLEWDGKDSSGKPVAAGSYRWRAVAKDRFGNTFDQVYDQLLISNKRIVISLDQQKLWAYEGDKPVLDSLVTTGNPALPTPLGTFQILTKQKDFTFHSPWPKGDKFWYPDSPTKFAMMFDDGGYFIHDAPWRHKFGPGSNLVPGQPGEDVTGTHGCVNVPSDVQPKLFAWADMGTPVVIQR